MVKMNELIHLSMNEAYWNAARAVCEICADPKLLMSMPLVKVDGEFEHKYIISLDCTAGPIHALIEGLAEVTP